MLPQGGIFYTEVYESQTFKENEGESSSAHQTRSHVPPDSKHIPRSQSHYFILGYQCRLSKKFRYTLRASTASKAKRTRRN